MNLSRYLFISFFVISSVVLAYPQGNACLIDLKLQGSLILHFSGANECALPGSVATNSKQDCEEYAKAFVGRQYLFSNESNYPGSISECGSSIM